jgi:hypothetical protein
VLQRAPFSPGTIVLQRAQYSPGTIVLQRALYSTDTIVLQRALYSPGTNYEISNFWIIALALKLLYRIGFFERKSRLCKKIPNTSKLNQSSTPIFRIQIRNRIGSGFNGSADPDPGRPNWLPKREKRINFMFEESERSL